MLVYKVMPHAQEKLDNFLRYMKNELERQARLYPSKFTGSNGRNLCQ